MTSSEVVSYSVYASRDLSFTLSHSVCLFSLVMLLLSLRYTVRVVLTRRQPTWAKHGVTT